MKTFAQFVQEAKGDGASPYEVYKAPAQPTKPSPPPADFRDKYLPKPSVKQAQLAPSKPLPPVSDYKGPFVHTDSPATKLRRLQLERPKSNENV